MPKSKHKVVVTRCLKKYNSHEFNEDLKCNFENFDFDTSNPNEMLETWKSIFNVILEKHAPIRISKVRSEYAPWLTNNIKKNMYHRDYLKKMAIKHNSLHYHEAFKTQRNKVNKIIKESKSEYYRNKIVTAKNKPREMVGLYKSAHWKKMKNNRYN